MSDWKSFPLYGRLVECLPAYVTETRDLNVKKLHQALQMSHEGVYKWLRSGRLKPENAEAIVELATSDQANRAALKAAGRKPPKFEDFTPFFRRRAA